MADAITRINPSTLPDSTSVGYSQITTVEPGRLAFISGQVAATADGRPVPADLASQCKIVVANARAALKAAGASPESLVMVRIYLVALTPERVDIAMPYVGELFDGNAPSLTGIGVAALASPDFQIELEMVARVPD